MVKEESILYIKRTLRDFEKNKIKYISFFLLIVLSVTVIIGFNRSMDSYVKTVEKFFETNNAEDGQFSVYGELSKRRILNLEEKYGIDIEEVKSYDSDLLKDAQGNSISRDENIECANILSHSKFIMTARIKGGRSKTVSSTNIILNEYDFRVTLCVDISSSNYTPSQGNTFDLKSNVKNWIKSKLSHL